MIALVINNKFQKNERNVNADISFQDASEGIVEKLL
jgi:hypothetical protein